MKRLARCPKCGGITSEEDKRTHSVITCLECGDVDYNYQGGRDDGPDPTERAQKEFDEEDEEDDDSVPFEWWDADEDEADE